MAQPQQHYLAVDSEGDRSIKIERERERGEGKGERHSEQKKLDTCSSLSFSISFTTVAHLRWGGLQA